MIFLKSLLLVVYLTQLCMYRNELSYNMHVSSINIDIESNGDIRVLDFHFFFNKFCKSFTVFYGFPEKLLLDFVFSTPSTIPSRENTLLHQPEGSPAYWF